ncbi:hypothetical protein [Mycobacterium dioxanotrophicus]|uniref:hypothetical protein n=1 Tax=Mycobacterium dioxanotrophicus TaxID=482462 RepID=UPI0012F9D571|nr:hypothetical protein [Mycobacterium dioxanotrophicus]
MSAETRSCQACWTEFTATTPTKIYCSDRCRKHAWEQRKHSDTAATVTEARPPAHSRPPPVPARIAANPSPSSLC